MNNVAVMKLVGAMLKISVFFVCLFRTISVRELRASLAVRTPQAEIRRYLAPDGYKIWSWKAHFPSGELRGKVEFKHK
jgi:hypothetical protein